ncbi:MAG: Gfo/Idh/MocA family protein [Candidatus Sumerlaeaceae bacterium]
MKLGIVGSTTMADFWRAAAMAADARADIKYYESDVPGADLAIADCEVVWIPASSMAVNHGAGRVLYNPAADPEHKITNGSPSFPLRHRSEIRHLKQVLEGGKLGQVGTVRLSLCRSASAPGPLCYSEFSPVAGALQQLGGHGFDAIHWCFGNIERVHAVESSESTNAAQYALLVARLDSGAIAHLELSFAEPAGGDYLYYEIAAKNGIVEYDSRKEPTLELVAKTSAAPATSPPPELVAELRAFLRNETANFPTHADAAAASQLVKASRASVI